jgi:enterochelin esterase-like enzyme
MRVLILLRRFILSAGVTLAALVAPAQPRVAEDGRVTFLLAAPAARKVELHCDNVPPTELQRGPDGSWAATTARLEPDLYGYVFVVDGVRMTDPANPSETHVSLVLVPDRTDPRPWERTDVPRGVVHRHSYRSALAEEEREFLVYTPPGYETARGDFPVLYLLHGAGDQPPGWTALGRAHVILDNLIARGRAVPMVVVMPSTFGRESRRHPPPASGAAWLEQPDIWRTDARQCREILRREIRPQVEALYRVRRGPEDRAVAGLSLGGAHALAAGLIEPGDYGWVGAFSSGGPFRIYARDFPGAFPAVDQTASRVRLLWVSCGRDDGLFGINREFSAWLDGRGVKHRWVETAGGHNWTVWRRNLADFVPQLFREGQ